MVGRDAPGIDMHCIPMTFEITEKSSRCSSTMWRWPWIASSEVRATGSGSPLTA
ncbi:hypothetical protein I552_5753 [Mycobacterium xenopi 3993]|nr:hypothetical protein I552_5753 [Mycobacterium xenopi 3993]